MGRSMIIWNGIVDDELRDKSNHPLTNQSATTEFKRQQALLNQKESELRTLITQADNAIKAMRATTTTRGMVQLTTAANITDPNAAALSGTEKNATVAGSLAASISNESGRITYVDRRITDVWNNLDPRVTNTINRANSCFNELDARGIFAGPQYASFNNIPMYGDFRHAIVHYSGSDSVAPITVSDPDWWWEVLSLGSHSRGAQLAFSVFRNRDYVYYRVVHDGVWYGWYKLHGYL